MVTRTELHRCPYCNYKLDAIGDPSDTQGAPGEGDCAICFSCYRPLVLTAGLAVRKPTPEEQADFDADPDISRLQEVMQMSRRASNALRH